MTSSNYE